LTGITTLIKNNVSHENSLSPWYFIGSSAMYIIMGIITERVDDDDDDDNIIIL